jgi:hypothetical protein
MPQPPAAGTSKVTMPTSRSTSEADAFLAAHPDAETVDMVIADMNGILRGKQLARNYLRKLYSDGVRLPGSNYLLDWTGQNVTSLKFGTSDGDPDYFCFPVKGTLKSVPWSLRPSGQVLASMFHEDGTPWFADPRHILARAMQPLADMKLTPVVAIEYEFYLIDQKAAAEGTVRPAASPQSGWRSTTTSVYALDDLYDFEELLGDIHEACALQSIPAETFVKEYAPGQFEINLHHVADPLEACDQAILLERAIKQVARRHGVIATFMAKPFADCVGSGLHVHVSLVDGDGRNVFAGPTDPKRSGARSATPCAMLSAGCSPPCRKPWRSSPPTPIPTAACAPAPMPRCAGCGAATTAPFPCASPAAEKTPRASSTASPAPTPTPISSSPRCSPASTTGSPTRSRRRSRLSATAMPRTAAWRCRSAGPLRCSSSPTARS